MSFTIYVRMKKLGKQKKEDLVPVLFTLDAKPQNVRELLISLTKLGVRQYNEREDAVQILSYLTKDEITSQAERGKITFGLRGGADAVEEKAIKNTLQCFTDGIYRVFAGDKELTELSDAIPWTEDLVFTFIRLTMLSGWQTPIKHIFI